MTLIPDKFFHSFTAKFFVFLGVNIILLIVAVFLAYNPSSEFYGTVLTHLNTTQKVVALTFDDGPNGQATADTLAILQKENVHATFFFIGDNVAHYPDLAKQVADAGNEIGNHTMHHDRTLPFEDPADIKQDLLDTNQIIFETTGQNPKFFRPPYGFRTPWIIGTAQKSGFVVVTWNDLTTDFQTKTTAAMVERNILNHVRPGSIIVLHDGSGTAHDTNRSDMLGALPKIIETLKGEGYQFVTLSQYYHDGYGK